MARIRTVKPDLFRHEGLFHLEQETKLPIRVAWSGLFTVCDREGRFEWKPNVLKLDILPFDSVDMERVLDALVTRGFLVKYACGNGPQRRFYGFLPTFKKHQVINNKEKPSSIPAVDDKDSEIIMVSDASPTRPPRVNHASTTPLSLSRGEGKGRERKGKGTEPSDGGEPTVGLTVETRRAYENAFRERYGTVPKWNGSVAGKMAQFVKRVGREDAPFVAEFFLRHNDAFYERQMHSVGLMLKDAEKLYAEWTTGRQSNATSARMNEKEAHWHGQMERVMKGEL